MAKRKIGCGKQSKRIIMHGKGFWDDIGNGFKSVGNFVVDKVLPKVIDVGLPLLAKAAMGGAGRKRMRGGASIPKIQRYVIKA